MYATLSYTGNDCKKGRVQAEQYKQELFKTCVDICIPVEFRNHLVHVRLQLLSSQLCNGCKSKCCATGRVEGRCMIRQILQCRCSKSLIDYNICQWSVQFGVSSLGVLAWRSDRTWVNSAIPEIICLTRSQRAEAPSLIVESLGSRSRV
jgi:hypothetical protein